MMSVIFILVYAQCAQRLNLKIDLEKYIFRYISRYFKDLLVIFLLCRYIIIKATDGRYMVQKRLCYFGEYFLARMEEYQSEVCFNRIKEGNCCHIILFNQVAFLCFFIFELAGIRQYRNVRKVEISNIFLLSRKFTLI